MERRVISLKEYKDKQSIQPYKTYVTEDTTPIDEKSVSVAQQRLFGMAWAVRSGSMERKDVPATVLGIVDSNMTDKQIQDFAKTSHEGLPNHKTNESNVIIDKTETEIGNITINLSGKDLISIVAVIDEPSANWRPGSSDADEVMGIIKIQGPTLNFVNANNRLFAEWYANKEIAEKELRKVFSSIRQQKNMK